MGAKEPSQNSDMHHLEGPLIDLDWDIIQHNSGIFLE